MITENKMKKKYTLSDYSQWNNPKNKGTFWYVVKKMVLLKVSIFLVFWEESKQSISTPAENLWQSTPVDSRMSTETFW